MQELKPSPRHLGFTLDLGLFVLFLRLLQIHERPELRTAAVMQRCTQDKATRDNLTSSSSLPLPLPLSPASADMKSPNMTVPITSAVPCPVDLAALIYDALATLSPV